MRDSSFPPAHTHASDDAPSALPNGIRTCTDCVRSMEPGRPPRRLAVSHRQMPAPDANDARTRAPCPGVHHHLTHRPKPGPGDHLLRPNPSRHRVPGRPSAHVSGHSNVGAELLRVVGDREPGAAPDRRSSAPEAPTRNNDARATDSCLAGLHDAPEAQPGQLSSLATRDVRVVT
jgi:hypothetical protein